MNTFSTPLRAHHSGAAANAVTQRKQAQSAFQFKDNRPEAATQRKVQDMANGRSSAKAIAQRHALEDEGTNETESEMMEEQKQAEMAPSETAGHEEAPVQMVPFNKKQRDRILAKNYARNGNFYTCQNPLCGFQHGLLNYATYKGRRQGDGGFHVDHIHAAANGGRALIRNAQVLCGTCNTSKGRRAAAGRYGINKYRALHQKRVAKNYKIKRKTY